MLKSILFIVCMEGLLLGCSSPVPKEKVKTSETEQEGPVESNDQLVEPEKARTDLDSLIKVSKPNFGYRFQVEGDFDGDGKTELLTEHYVSQITGKEINKYFDDMEEYGTEVELTTYREPFSFVSSSNPLVKDLDISKDPQLFGLKLLKNEGDLDGDGADELSYIISWADWSSVNHWNIVSYKKGEWEVLYSFEIRDWQTPYLPEYYDENGSFLKSGKVLIPLADTMNLRMEKELLEFKGLVRKIKPGKIEVTCMNQSSDEVKKVVTLKK